MNQDHLSNFQQLLDEFVLGVHEFLTECGKALCNINTIVPQVVLIFFFKLKLQHQL